MNNKSRLHLESLREFELSCVKKFLPATNGISKPTILDLGAGSGYQSAKLEAMGYHVVAFDIEKSAYENTRVFPVCIYDGTVIPIKSESVDAVFSSNVLEHVPDVQNLLNEIRRVLSPGGHAIHIVPTSAWRFWTTLMHYPWGIKRLIFLALGGDRTATVTNDQDQVIETTSFYKDLFPRRHGTRGNFITELNFFSAAWWNRCFEHSGFSVIHQENIGLFYTGTMFLGKKLSTTQRKVLSRVFGSACRVYVLKPKQAPDNQGARQPTRQTCKER